MDLQLRFEWQFKVTAGEYQLINRALRGILSAQEKEEASKLALELGQRRVELTNHMIRENRKLDHNLKKGK